MPAAAVRTVLPLASATAAGMLAMDLFLPVVPSLQAALAIDVRLAQATVAVFLVGLAASQLFWGEVLSRFGPRRCLWLGTGLLALTGFGCALAGDIRWLLAMRLLQGIAAGAATVVAPAVVRATLADVDAVRGIAAIAMVESVVPAAAPVLGAALLGVIGWRGMFWLIGGAALLVLPWVLRITPRELPGLDRRVKSGYRQILGNRKYLRLTLSHALCFGTLITFVASAPQLMVHALGLDVAAFATLQVIGVAGFMLGASQSARVSRRIGLPRAVLAGAWVHVGLCAGLVVLALTPRLGFVPIAVIWCGYCMALAIRGPAAFSDLLALPPSQMGRGSAMAMLAMLLAAAAGTQAVAPFMNGRSALPLALAMLLMSLLSVALVTPYPRAVVALRR